MKTFLRIIEIFIVAIAYIIIITHIWGCVGERVERMTFVPYQREVIPRVPHVEEKKTYKLNVDYISQYPELPTGCEMTSLTMVLNYYGYNVEKEELVDEYMIYRDSEPTGFDGDPYSADGGAMWPPALAAAATNFMEDHNDERVGIDVSGASLAELLHFIEDGIPVIVWVNGDFEPYIEYDGIQLWEEDKVYYSYWNEHCVVLTGFDEENVYIQNPQVGEEKISIEDFEEVYEICGKYAIIINIKGE